MTSKKLAIFCDGTWNDLSLDKLTNVVRLAKCVAPVSRHGRSQIVYYDEGVGVGSNVSFVADKLTKYLGGALGRGLDRKIEAAYRFLVLNYQPGDDNQPGDDIYVFGFSRGAYTARSLCGLIRKCGIVRRDCFEMIPHAIRNYRGPKHSNSAEMMEFRQSYAHPAATGVEDHDRLKIRAEDAIGRAQGAETREHLYQYRPAPTYRMMYVGLWDTVGAMGIPTRFDFVKFNRRYAFHDTDASTLMASIRHAAAANEKRALFDLTAISNIDELNRRWARMTGWDVDDPSDPRHVPYANRPYQQRWFPGDHCSVGGGRSEIGLSSASLLWIAQGAEWAGLAFTEKPEDELGKACRCASSCADLGENGAGSYPGGTVRRRGAPFADEIADPTWDRAKRDPAYRPPNLHVMKGLWERGIATQDAPPGFPPPPPSRLSPTTSPVAPPAPPPPPGPASPAEPRPVHKPDRRYKLQDRSEV